MGVTLTLTPTVQPENATNKRVAWKSSNTAVATVANGTITALKAGTSTITATTEDGGKTASCALTVSQNAEPGTAVTGVTLSDTIVWLAPTNTKTLTATVLPANATNKAVTWESANPAAATVLSNGLVTAIANGTVLIYAITQDGGKMASCLVKVGALATSLTLPATATLYLGNRTSQQLTANVQPSNAVNGALTWTSSNTAVATVSGSGLVTAVAEGTTTITATTEDGSKTATCVVTAGLGTVSFATTQTWTVGSQTWSDAVQATGCDKTTFYGGTADCRSNPYGKGDLFSWYAVSSYNYRSKLCPDGWRVPTVQDFIDLDIALGGTGNRSQNNTTLRDAYLNTWGGVYGGYCYSDGKMSQMYFNFYFASYWSQSSSNNVAAYYLYFDYYDPGNNVNDTGGISVNPRSENDKSYGRSLRCVR